MKQEEYLRNLVSRISQVDDEKAFKELFDYFAGRLFQFSMSFLKNKYLAEEAVSDVMFKLWLNRDSLNQDINLKAYLFKATYNTSLNYLDELKRKKAVSLDDVEVDLGVDRICPETDLITKELKQTIEKAIETLPPRCKLIYKMAKVEQMKYKEIAELLSISVKTIDHQLTIAIKKIGEVIQQYLLDQNSDENYLLLLKLFVPTN